MHMIALEPTAHSIRSARAFVADLLDHDDVSIREIVVLLVSELVTNAVQHGGPYGPTATVDLQVEARSDLVRVEVTDAGSGDPRPGDGAIDRPAGRGLMLVEALATRWGCDRLPAGKTVWFELLTPAGGDVDG